MSNILKNEYFLVGLLMLVGLFLCFWLAPYSSFWGDESMVLNLTYKTNSQIVNFLLTQEATPPLYYFLIKAVRVTLGDKESYFRLISGVFFLLSGLFYYKLGKKIGGKTTGLISLVMWSTSYFLLYFSKQARPYGLSAFFSVASFYFFLKCFDEYKIRNAIFYLFFTILGLYTSYWFALLLIAQIVIFFAGRNKNWKMFWWMFGAGLAFLPWGIVYLLKFHNYGVGAWIEKPGLATVWESLGYFGWGQWYAIIPATLIGAVYGFVKKTIDFKKILPPFLCFIIPIVTAFIISQFVPIYTPGRREIIVIPAFVVLISYLISRIENVKWKIIVAILLMFFSIQTISDFNAQAKDWNSSDFSVISEIKSKINNGDYVVIYGLVNADFNYYSRRIGMDGMINKIFFPLEMATNTDSLGPVKILESNPNKLNSELEKLGEQLSAIGNAKIYVFLSGDQVSGNLTDFLDKKFKRVSQLIPQEPHMPTWINEVVVYENKK